MSGKRCTFAQDACEQKDLFSFLQAGASGMHLEVDNGHNVARLICTATAQFRRMLSHQGQTPVIFW
jgi:hypothetical protein